MALTFLVGASGSATGFGVVASIRAVWGGAARIVALDTNPPERNAAAIVADEYVQVPPADAADYPARLREAARGRSGRLVYIPIFDSEILVAARLAEQRTFPGLDILTAGDSAAIDACNDKLTTWARLAAAAVPAAATTPLATAQFTGRAVVKPRRGVASKPAHVDTLDDLLAFRGTLDTSAFIVQERCDPPEVTIDAFVGRDDGPNRSLRRALARERLQVKAGVVTKARLFEDRDLSALAPSIAAALGLHGTFCFQVLRGRDGGWRVIDVNPRPGGGTRMSAAVGSDFAAAAIADFLGEPADRFFNTPALPQFVVRQYAEYVTTPAAAEAPAAR